LNLTQRDGLRAISLDIFPASFEKWQVKAESQKGRDGKKDIWLWRKCISIAYSQSDIFTD